MRSRARALSSAISESAGSYDPLLLFTLFNESNDTKRVDTFDKNSGDKIQSGGKARSKGYSLVPQVRGNKYKTKIKNKH